MDCIAHGVDIAAANDNGGGYYVDWTRRRFCSTRQGRDHRDLHTRNTMANIGTGGTFPRGRRGTHRADVVSTRVVQSGRRFNYAPASPQGRAA